MKYKTLDKRTRKKRRKELNAKRFPSEVWFEKLMRENGLNLFRKNMCLIGIFFGDFVWRRSKIVVEIDGSSHDGKEKYDAWRDGRLKKSGYRVFRIRHNDTQRACDVIEILKKIENNTYYQRKKTKEERRNRRIYLKSKGVAKSRRKSKKSRQEFREFLKSDEAKNQVEAFLRSRRND